MKKILLYIMIFGLCAFSIGCTQNQEEPIEEPTPIEDPVQGEDDKQIDEVEISPSDKVDIENLTLLDEYDFDFDNDGNEEKIAIYTEAGKDSNGAIAWDDGQNWLFVVHGTDKDYVLLDEYVQLGSIDFFIYTIDDVFHIATVDGRTASLKLTIYRYDSDNDIFFMSTPYNATGDVNLIKSSYGY